MEIIYDILKHIREKQKIMQIFKKKIRKSEGFTSTQNPPPSLKTECR